jgi:hypothetical protein
VPLVPLAAPVPPLLVAPLVPLLPDASLPCFMLLHADSAIASKPAKTKLWCLCFMINSFCLDIFSGCVTMPRATLVRGAIGGVVPADSAGP